MKNHLCPEEEMIIEHYVSNRELSQQIETTHKMILSYEEYLLKNCTYVDAFNLNNYLKVLKDHCIFLLNIQSKRAGLIATKKENNEH